MPPCRANNPSRASQFHVPTSCADWVISWTWTVRMRFGQEGMATYISAFEKGDLLRQEIVQQLKQYFKLLTLSLESTQCKCDKTRTTVMQLRPPQSISQSVNQPID